jgi:hypothetical protein
MPDKQRIRAGKILIRRVFLEEWDPIGVREEPNAQDEYDSYLGGMVSLLERNASTEEIAGYLREIETDCMGLNPNEQNLAAVAIRLRSLRW